MQGDPEGNGAGQDQYGRNDVLISIRNDNGCTLVFYMERGQEVCSKNFLSFMILLQTFS